MTLHCLHHKKSDSDKRFRPVVSCIRPLHCKRKNQEQCLEVMCRTENGELVFFLVFLSLQAARSEKWMRLGSANTMDWINRDARKTSCWCQPNRTQALRWQEGNLNIFETALLVVYKDPPMSGLLTLVWLFICCLKQAASIKIFSPT